MTTVDGVYTSQVEFFEGETAVLAVSLSKEDITGDASYVVADPSVCTVENGVLTALKEGSTTVEISYTDDDNKTYTFVLTVTVYADYLVENGQTEYVLVVPAATKTLLDDHDAPKTAIADYNYGNKALFEDQLTVATIEFVSLFKQATGIQLSVVGDNDVEYSAQAKYISLGNTTLFQSASIGLELSALGADGVRIITKDNSIFLLGGNGRGVAFAVYEFMEETFGFDAFFRDCIVIEEGVSEKRLPHFDLTELPDIATRANGLDALLRADLNWAGAGTDAATCYYNLMTLSWRYRTSEKTILPIYAETGTTSATNATIHNTLEYAPYETYASQYADWYWQYQDSPVRYDICFTAHGNVTAYNALVELFANKIINSLTLHSPTTDPMKNVAVICLEDGYFTTCPCTACAAIGNGADTGVRFTNDVNKAVRARMADEANAAYARDDLLIVFMAYHGFLTAPTTQTMDEGVGVYLAPSAGISYVHSINDTVNADGKANIEKWATVSNGNMLLYTYNADYKLYSYFVDTSDFYSSTGYTWFKNLGVSYWYNLNQNGNYGVSSAWSLLKVYLDSKLAWDTSADVETLTDRYFAAMYGDAAEKMRAIYELERAKFAEIKAQIDTDEPTLNLTLNDGYYTESELVDWLKAYDAAYEAIKTETDATKYAILKKHIDTEWLSVVYRILNRERTTLNVSVSGKEYTSYSVNLLELKEKFKTTALEVRLRCYCEGGYMFAYENNAWTENEIFWENFGYRNIFGTINSRLFSIRCSIDGGTTYVMAGTNRTLSVGDVMRVDRNIMGGQLLGSSNDVTTADGCYEKYQITFSLEENNGTLSISDRNVTAEKAGSDTLIMTYVVDGVTYTVTCDIVVE